MSTSVEGTRHLGRVKWFNNRAGYGFITSTVGADGGDTDVFAHQSNICTAQEQYRYLIEGEYVSFSIEDGTAGRERHAASVTGVNGGKLMCETRSEHRARAHGEDQDGADGQSEPAAADEDAGGWKMAEGQRSHHGTRGRRGGRGGSVRSAGRGAGRGTSGGGNAPSAPAT